MFGYCGVVSADMCDNIIPKTFHEIEIIPLHITDILKRESRCKQNNNTVESGDFVVYKLKHLCKNSETEFLLRKCGFADSIRGCFLVIARDNRVFARTFSGRNQKLEKM